MARINLLPWRIERRRQRQREFYGMLGLAAVSGLLLSLMVWFYYDRQVSGQGERNAFLQTEIDKVKKQNEEIGRLDTQKDRLLARKRVIEELQAKRSQMVHLFDALVRTIPDGVVLTGIKQDGETLTLEGRTQSNARVSAYMRSLATSGWMSNPELSIIEARDPEKEAAAGPVADIKALPYVFVVKVKLPAQSEGVLGPDGSVIDPALDATGGAEADVDAAAAAPAALAPAPEAAPGTPSDAADPAAPAAPTDPARPQGSRLAPPGAPATGTPPPAAPSPQKGAA